MHIYRIEPTEKGCRALVFGNTAYLSGIVATDFQAETEVQITQALERVSIYLEKVGSTKDWLLNATVYLKSIDDYDQMNRLWSEWLRGHEMPTRTTVIAAMTNPGILFEVSIVTAVPS